jgi:hypothetical protein
MTAIPPTVELGARSSAAERMRRHRQRRKIGLRCVTIELSKSEIDGLARMGFLKSEMRNDTSAVRDALYAFCATHWIEYRKLRYARRSA